jgi:hypothetical protein
MVSGRVHAWPFYPLVVYSLHTQERWKHRFNMRYAAPYLHYSGFQPSHKTISRFLLPGSEMITINFVVVHQIKLLRVYRPIWFQMISWWLTAKLCHCHYFEKLDIVAQSALRSLFGHPMFMKMDWPFFFSLWTKIHYAHSDMIFLSHFQYVPTISFYTQKFCLQCYSSVIHF